MYVSLIYATQDDWNVLQIACSLCDINAINYAIEAGADVNIQSSVSIASAAQSINDDDVMWYRVEWYLDARHCTF